MVRGLLMVAAIMVMLVLHMADAGAAVQLSDVFVGGAEGPGGTANYRIPALIVAPNGNLVAFAEARPLPNDPSEVLGVFTHLVSKVSTDGGTSWSAFKTVAANDPFSYGDPRPYVDAPSGNLFVQYTQFPDGGKAPPDYVSPPGLGPESSVAYYRSSTDNGQTWNTAPVNINAQVKDASAWFETANGAGAGIQLRWQADPARNGRLVVPAYVVPFDYVAKNVSFYSDDHGLTWNHSPIAPIAPNPYDSTNTEAQIVELTNGDLQMDTRGVGRPRWISHDGGATWEDGSYAAWRLVFGDFPMNMNGGMTRYSAKRDGDDRDRILFSIALGNPPGSASDRSHIGVWTSYDEGKTFINPVIIDPASGGFGGYSAIQRLPDGSIGVLYERTASTNIKLARFIMADLEGQNFSSDLGQYEGFGNQILIHGTVAGGERKRGGVGWSGSWAGTSTATNEYSAQLGGTGLQFVGSSFSAQDGRMDLTPGHNTAQRQLATPINLNTNSTAYLAVLASQALDTSSNLFNKPLNIELLDASEVSRVSFGVGNLENFFINKIGGTYSTAAGVVSGSATYFLLLKIVSQDSSQPGNFDQIFLKVFQSGVDAIPATDASLTWTLVGSTSANSNAILDQIALTSGSAAVWTFDELRIGGTFSAVTAVAIPEPGSVAMLLSAALILLLVRAPPARRSTCLRLKCRVDQN